MRATRIIGSLAWLLALGLPAPADPVPAEAVVIAPVEVRSGPSEKFYSTSRLNAGERVKVADEKVVPWLADKAPPAGWLAILPPPGSFSWVNQRFLTIHGQTAMVHEEAPVRVGSSLYNGPPEVEQVKLQRGLVVTIVGAKETSGDGIWWPIAPAPQEVRYIPANAVQAAAPVQTASSSAPPAAGQKAAGPDAPDDPLWAQAEQAKREGKLAEAHDLFMKLASQTKDHGLQVRCYNQMAYLKNTQPPAMPTYVAGRPAAPGYPNAAADARIVPTPSYPYPQTVGTPPASPSRATSQYTYVPQRPGYAGGQGAAWTGANGVAVPPPQWKGPGRLVRSAVPVHGQPAYVLDMGGGQPLVYVTAQPGVNLEPYVNRYVSLLGPVDYHMGYRKEHLTALQVVPQ